MTKSELLLGLDIGSSSIKASVIDAGSGLPLATAISPDDEMEILAINSGWAEQEPELWWHHVKLALKKLSTNSNIDLKNVRAIGVSYQMHGLVLLDKLGKVLRPSIIWCDSRAVDIGARAFNSLGHEICLKHHLNSPGNFTASKLRWVMEHEPKIFEQVDKFMLPGDYIAYRLTGEKVTTPSGLSEGILWDFQNQAPAEQVLSQYEISTGLIPDIRPNFSIQGQVLTKIAEELDLTAEIPVSYRAGDQPNNAFSLNVLNPGEVAATAGTSGVIYGVSAEAKYDRESRVNSFLHVNHTVEKHRLGVLLCINGTGILNSWLRKNFAAGLSYDQVNVEAGSVGIGAEGLSLLPYGNGAERSLGNRNLNASVHGLQLTRHSRAHVLRAAQEGIVFSLNYGLEIMRNIGVAPTRIRAGKANMFLSPLFASAFATVTGVTVELYNTDGAQGAARGAGLGAGIFRNEKEAFRGLTASAVVEPKEMDRSAYLEAWGRWNNELQIQLKNCPTVQ